MNTKDLAIMMAMRIRPIDKCTGCNRIGADGYCTTFVIPSARWPEGESTVENKCLLASHVTASAKKDTKKVNALKASRRAAKGR